MEEGKLSVDILEQLLQKQGYSNPGIILGPGLGFDAAVIDFEQASIRACDFYQSSSPCHLILKTDPITFPTPNPGRYAVIVCANDVVTTGALPFGFGATIVLPPCSPKDEVISLQDELDRVCNELEIAILGGHTEVSRSVTRMIISGTMIGLVPADYYINREVKVNDKIIVSGTCGMEGTSILAREGYEKLSSILGEQSIKVAEEYSQHLSIVDRALTVNKATRPGLIHDATEGGILGALYEVIAPTGLGAQIDKELIPISEVTSQICELLAIDVLRLISSGTMVLVASEEDAEECVQLLRKSLPAEIVGEVRRKNYGIRLDTSSIEPPGPDQVINGLQNLEAL